MNKLNYQVVIKTAFVFLFVVLSCGIYAQVPSKPSTERLVNDFAGLYTPEQVAQLEAFLVMVDDSSSNQICVVTVKDLGGMDANQFATELGQSWGIGGEKDNGIVVLIQPKTDELRGQVYIAVGYGLESVIPDFVAGQIRDEIMIPSFKQNDYYGGTYTACETLYKIAKGEINIKKKKSGSGYGKLIFIIILIVLFIAFSSKKNKNNNGKDGHTTYGGSALPWLLMGSGFGGRSSGGSSGGGFGGFGGGGFGGGGAGGSW